MIHEYFGSVMEFGEALHKLALRRDGFKLQLASFFFHPVYKIVKNYGPCLICIIILEVWEAYLQAKSKKVCPLIHIEYFIITLALKFY
nr:hypothetical protein Iba_chr02bCG17760 [Ipomoea batatas]